MMLSRGEEGRRGGRGLERRESINIWEMTERVCPPDGSVYSSGESREKGREGRRLWWNIFRGRHVSLCGTRARQSVTGG